jgi:hypothetical protein
VRANAAGALYRLGRAPVELVRLLDDREPAARANAALALARNPSARRAIGRLAERDEDRFARAAAQRAQRGPALPTASDWITFDVVDFDGAPLGDARYRLVFPDGVVKLGLTDERGIIAEERVPSGGCTLALDEVTGSR